MRGFPLDWVTPPNREDNASGLHGDPHPVTHPHPGCHWTRFFGRAGTPTPLTPQSG